MPETPAIKSIEPFIMFDLPETPIEPIFFAQNVGYTFLLAQ